MLKDSIESESGFLGEGHVVRVDKPTCRRLSSQRRLAVARRLIHTHYFEPLTLAQIAAAANMSVFHFSRSFRAAYGKSPHQEVVELRVRLAEHLLVGTRIEIAAIARAVGFDSRSTLFRHFVRLRNESPLAMRQRLFREQAQLARWRKLETSTADGVQNLRERVVQASLRAPH